MKRGAILFAVALGACSQAPLPRGGIVSTNPCADAILVRLVRPERIAAISHYSQDPAATSLPLSVARRFAVTAGTAEEVIARAPDLVLADSFAPSTTLAAYRRAGLRVVVLDSPSSVAASIAQVRQVAAAVRAVSRGEDMVREIEGALSSSRSLSGGGGPFAQRMVEGQSHPSLMPLHHDAMHRGLPPRDKLEEDLAPSALFYISGDLASGSGNLLDELMRSAGLRNAAAKHGLSFTGKIPVETLVAQPPDVVIATGAGRTEALRQRLLPGVPQVSFPRTLMNCGGPSIPPALARLRAIRGTL